MKEIAILSELCDCYFCQELETDVQHSNSQPCEDKCSNAQKDGSRSIALSTSNSNDPEELPLQSSPPTTRDPFPELVGSSTPHSSRVSMATIMTSSPSHHNAITPPTTVSQPSTTIKRRNTMIQFNVSHKSSGNNRLKRRSVPTIIHKSNSVNSFSNETTQREDRLLENPELRPISSSEVIINRVQVNESSSQPWYHGNITRQEATNIITQQGASDGLFLIRDNSTSPGNFSLSLAHDNTVKHCKVHQHHNDDVKCYSLDGGRTKFSDLTQLVCFYKLNNGGLPVCLSRYVTKQS